jgi:predicted DNA-binding transcriptional regulator AlpA
MEKHTAPTASAAVPVSSVSRIVRSIAERAEQLGISDKTLRNLIASGQGPRVIQLSPGRVGIRDDHFAQWMDSRVRDDATAA